MGGRETTFAITRASFETAVSLNFTDEKFKTLLVALESSKYVPGRRRECQREPNLDSHIPKLKQSMLLRAKTRARWEDKWKSPTIRLSISRAGMIPDIPIPKTFLYSSCDITCRPLNLKSSNFRFGNKSHGDTCIATDASEHSSNLSLSEENHFYRPTRFKWSLTFSFPMCH